MMKTEKEGIAMLEGFCLNMVPVKKAADRLEKKHPVFCMLIFQAAVAVFLIAAVGGIALVGGSVIWLFYRLMGIG